MPWYDGPSLLHHLEDVHIGSDRNLIDARFPVQYVIRPMSDEHHDYRGYAGQVAGGMFRPGDEVMVLPSGFTTHDRGHRPLRRGQLDEAFPPMSVTIRLERRHRRQPRRHDLPAATTSRRVTQDIDAMVCWFSERPLQVGGKYAIKHTTRSARALVKDLQYRLDVNTLHRDETSRTLALNEIGRVQPAHHRAAVLRRVPPQPHHRLFILIDEATNETVGAGMILDA